MAGEIGQKEENRHARPPTERQRWNGSSWLRAAVGGDDFSHLVRGRLTSGNGAAFQMRGELSCDKIRKVQLPCTIMCIYCTRITGEGGAVEKSVSTCWFSELDVRQLQHQRPNMICRRGVVALLLKPEEISGDSSLRNKNEGR